jgi:2-alkyl-3-oxoalkanoate reductase
MKIFVAVATGAIGRPLLAQLLAKKHDVVALTRSSEGAKKLAEQGIEPTIADEFDTDAVKTAVTHVQQEVVIEQLTALPKAYTRESVSAAAALNTRIRLEGSANVLAAARIAGVSRYIRQSISLGSFRYWIGNRMLKQNANWIFNRDRWNNLLAMPLPANSQG